MTTVKRRLRTLEDRSPNLTSGRIMAMSDRQLARAAGAPWLLACTDAELDEIALGVCERDPARYRDIVEAASKRPPPTI